MQIVDGGGRIRRTSGGVVKWWVVEMFGDGGVLPEYGNSCDYVNISRMFVRASHRKFPVQ